MAFTSREDGANLPADRAPWRKAGSGSPVPLGEGGLPMMEAVRRDGYFLLEDPGTG